MTLLLGRSRWREVPMMQPLCICRSCWMTWRARRPQPIAVYCHHLGGAARRTYSGRLEVNECVSAYALATLRASDAL
jgi:hypothetical protein